MAVPKICGIETEYGIVSRDAAVSNPITASSLLVNAYVSEVTGTGGGVGRPHQVGWDFEDESPDRDARGTVTARSYAPEVESHLVNAVLTNGSRFYVDHAHPELSTPECRTADEVLIFDRAGEEILVTAMAAVLRMNPDEEIIVHKNNSDGKGQSYGCHENYLIDRALPFGTLTRHATTHFVTRQLFTGSGKLGSETPGAAGGDHAFQITQRADFFEEPIGLETTLKRPIVNTRDEPHADPRLYRRLHVICGDANMSETATFLKVGSTALWFAAVEDGAVPTLRNLAHPVEAMKIVSRDLTLTTPLELSDGSTMTALEIQREIFETSAAYADSHGLDAVGEESGRRIIAVWDDVLSTLESDPALAADRLDWVAKLRLIEGFADRHGLEPGHPRLAALALQYHDLRPDRCLARRVGLVTLADPDAVRTAVTEPPSSTRAYFRGRCLSKFASDIVAANWDSMVFDIGGTALRRIPMMEPTRGTEAHVGGLIDESSTAAELIERLGS